MSTPGVVASARTLDAEPAARPHADWFELRLDLLDADPGVLDAYEGELPLIVTDRTDTDTSACVGSVIERLRQAIASDAVDAVDVDLSILEEYRHAEGATALRADLEASDTQVICSIHDTGHPVTYNRVCRYLETTVAHGDIGKVVVTPDTAAATGELIGALGTFRHQQAPVTAMAMGRFSELSRVMAVALACPLVYGSIPGYEPTAPGQPTVARLSAVVNALKATDR